MWIHDPIATSPYLVFGPAIQKVGINEFDRVTVKATQRKPDRDRAVWIGSAANRCSSGGLDRGRLERIFAATRAD
jgi:hypothetical protein